MTHALKFRAVVAGNTLVLPDLGAFEGKRVEVIVIEDDSGEPLPLHPPPSQRPLGLLRGTFVVPDDFDAPLSPELQRYFDGDDDR